MFTYGCIIDMNWFLLHWKPMTMTGNQFFTFRNYKLYKYIFDEISLEQK